MPDAGLTDIDVVTENIGTFARSGTGYNDSALRPLLYPASCSSVLDGCAKFAAADQEAITGVMQAVTGAEQLLNGVRQGASKMSQLYDSTDHAVAATQNNVKGLNDFAPHETGLPAVNEGLEAARAAGETASRLNAVG